MRQQDRRGPFPYLFVRAAHHDENWDLRKTYSIWLDNVAGDTGSDPVNDSEYADELDGLLKNDPEHILYWAYASIPADVMCEMASTWRARKSGELQYEIARTHGKRRLAEIHGRDATLVFVAPNLDKGGFNILFYEPHVQVEALKDSLLPDIVLTGRHSVWGTRTKGSDKKPFLDRFEDVAEVVRELVVRCEERLAAAREESHLERRSQVESASSDLARDSDPSSPEPLDDGNIPLREFFEWLWSHSPPSWFWNHVLHPAR